MFANLVGYRSQELLDPNEDFTIVCKDARQWNRIKDLTTTLGEGNPDFLWGVATCTYQDSGMDNCPLSQWRNWEIKKLPKDNRSGKSADLITLYKTDPQAVINRLAQLSVNSYRFSIEWSEIEKVPGQFDDAAMQVYVNFCKALRDAGIRPMITFHHFSEPSWFHDTNSFENEENIAIFARFCSYAYKALTEEYQGKILVDLFCTINEPAIEAFSRYLRGAFSPGIVMNFNRAGQFLKGALKAHTIVYDTLKAMSSGGKVSIGIVHQRLAFRAATVLVSPVTRTLTYFINEVTLHYLSTGFFEVNLSGICHIVEAGKKPGMDFVGLQYYVRPLIGLTGVCSPHGEPMTLMPFHEDPEGIYEAMVEVYEKCKVPLIITENGISTADEQQRYRYTERSLYAIDQAVNVIGKINFKGLYKWSIFDNLEWDMGMNPQRFGLYAVIDGVIADHPKAGAAPFIAAAKKARQLVG